MTEQPDIPAGDSALPSQIIAPDAGSAVGRGAVNPDAPKEEPKPEAAKPASNREALEKAFDEAENKAKGPEVPAKPDPATGKAEESLKEPAPKAEAGEAEKPAAGRDGDAPRQSEGRRPVEPPARFLPEARAKWANVPNEVKAEFNRVAEEYEREGQENRQFRDDLREFEDLARNHSVTVKDTMARYVAADRALNEDFGGGVVQMAQSYGHSPMHTIGAVLRAYGVTPQQYADHIMRNPQAAQMQPQQAPQQRQQSQASPEQIADMAAQRVADLMARQQQTQQLSSVLDDFAKDRPDYPSLEPQIAAILRSGVIDNLYGGRLTPDQRLAEAYRMAGGQGPTSRLDAPQDDLAHSSAAPRPVDPDGSKSIKGAPSGTHSQAARRFKSNRDAIEAAFAQRS